MRLKMCFVVMHKAKEQEKIIIRQLLVSHCEKKIILQSCILPCNMKKMLLLLWRFFKIRLIKIFTSLIQYLKL